MRKIKQQNGNFWEKMEKKLSTNVFFWEKCSNFTN